MNRPLNTLAAIQIDATDADVYLITDKEAYVNLDYSVGGEWVTPVRIIVKYEGEYVTQEIITLSAYGDFGCNDGKTFYQVTNIEIDCDLYGIDPLLTQAIDKATDGICADIEAHFDEKLANSNEY